MYTSGPVKLYCVFCACVSMLAERMNRSLFNNALASSKSCACQGVNCVPIGI